ncbi:MAG: CRISPR-associated endonuclease Cas3'' [Candidatus Limiplasma sp.]|nr:CRISPR-associated endonuclease Cas3'' [Candidatus Limiplasma sp.]
MRYLAHSGTQEQPQGHGLAQHLQEVSRLASSFMIHPLLAQLAALSGLYHDAGKYQEEFQRYLKKEHLGRVDHATLGGQLLARDIAKLTPAFMAAPIFGHHGGLPNAVHQEKEKEQRRRAIHARLQDPLLWDAAEAFAREVPPAAQFPALEPSTLRPVADNTFAFELFMAVRMVFSALVDADFLDTEAYFDPPQAALRGKRPALGELWERYWEYMKELPAKGSRLVQESRAHVLAQCLAAAEGFQGLYSLSVPTGGGKTLSSLAFALRHAQVHPNLKRIIYAIPFTSIIEQNAEVFRKAVGEDAVLEHHSAMTPPEEGTPTDRAAENWDAPLVVTTNVQLFESLFSNKPSRCRKLHNLQDSIIILDEMQALPDEVLRPCLAALESLALNYRATVVICTATQPNYDNVWTGRPQVREIIADPRALFQAMARTRVVSLGPLEDGALLERLSSHEQALCIVNSRAQAQALHEALGGEAHGAYHLSTWMCPEHRSQKLEEIRHRLKKGLRVRLVSTSLIEAGVDVDFPVVYRAAAGLESIAQAAGRCNRNGLLPGLAPVHVFEPQGWPCPPEVERLGQKTLAEVAPEHEDLLSREALNLYFTLRFGAGANLDQEDILRGILQTQDANFSYETISESFQFFANAGEALFIPYDDNARELIARLERGGELGHTLRRLQRYSVSLYAPQKRALTDRGFLRQINGVPVLDAAPKQMEGLYTWERGLWLGAELAALFS